jgi:hypothetical protein
MGRKKRAKNIDENLHRKAPLSEIFAALAGLTCAAVAIVKKGADSKEDALADLGSRAALKSQDMKNELFSNKDAGGQEYLAKDAMQFLETGARILVWYPHLLLRAPWSVNKGKTTRVLLAHIENMIEREKGDGARPIEKVKTDAGGRVAAFNASYLPRPQRLQEKENVLEDTEFSPSQGGRRKNYAWSRRALDLA